jgi:hypothetical protein
MIGGAGSRGGRAALLEETSHRGALWENASFDHTETRLRGEVEKPLMPDA